MTTTLKIPKTPLVMENGVVVIPHLGISIRAIAGCALADPNHTGRRVKVSYNNIIVAEIRLKTR